MSGVNKAILVGNLGRDPEIKYLDNGRCVANFSVATSESWTKDGEKQERTEWHKVVCWGKLAELAGEYLSKGRQVYVEGKIQSRKYTKDGVERTAYEIVAGQLTFLGGRGEAKPEREQAPAADYGPPPEGPDDAPF